MRSFFHALAVGIAFAALALPTVTFAQPANTAERLVPVRSTANSSTVQLSIPIGDTRSVSGLPEYIVTVYRYALGIVTLVAIIMVMYGGFRYLLGASVGDAKTGQTVIKDAIGGMAILFLAYVILYTVNPKTVRLSLPDIQRIQSVWLTGQQSMSPGMTCMKDTDCGQGSFCLRTSLVAGLCANGQPGNICRCRGTGCGITAEQAGGPTNNGGRGSVDCRAGSQCQEISDGNFVCNGGTTGSACNETTGSGLSAETQQGLSTAARTAANVAVSQLSPVPFSPFDTNGGPAEGPRQAIRCTQPGQYCFQPSERAAGACVYGDYRDTAMFEGIPEYRTNTGLQAAVQGCDPTEAQLRERPKANGGYLSLTVMYFDAFCMQHRYHCANGAVCSRSTYADMFATTLAQYSSWERVPQQLRPETYFRQGCLKAIGEACQQDNECPSKCLEGRCIGFGALAVRQGIPPGSISGQPGPDQLQYVYTTTGCADATWTAVDLFTENGQTSGAAGQRAAIDILFRAGTLDRFACYPKRPSGAKCDLSAQCTSGTCMPNPDAGPRPSIPATFSAPMDNNVGLGRCT